MNAVVTYIFGKHKEKLREPLVIDKDVEYICVTDQKDLKSKNWKIVYDDVPQAKCVRDKMVFVKYNPFKYTDAEKVCVIDGTLHITKSLKSLFELCKNDMLLKLHPQRYNLYDELLAWMSMRNLDKAYLQKFENMARILKTNLHNKFLVESCVIVWRNTDKILELCNTLIAYMKFLGNNTLFQSNQCVLTLLLETEFAHIKYDTLNQKKYFTRYKHNTDELADR